MRLEAAGYLARRAERRIWTMSRLARAATGSPTSSPTTAPSIATASWRSSRPLDVHVGAGALRRAEGVFLLEAMAAGVPVVQPRRGAFTEIVEKTGGGLLVPPDDPEALADGLFRLWQRSQPAATRWRRADSTASASTTAIDRSHGSATRGLRRRHRARRRRGPIRTPAHVAASH